VVCGATPKKTRIKSASKALAFAKTDYGQLSPSQGRLRTHITNWSVSCCQLQGLASADGPMNLARVASDSGPGFWYSNTAVPVRLVLVARLKPLDLAALFQNGKSFRFAKTGYGRLFFGRK
jgi:hypothetical protein